MITEREILDALASVEDPELGIGVVDLALVREVKILPSGVSVRMGLTSALCPMADELGRRAQDALATRFPDVHFDVTVQYDWRWSPKDMSEEARRRLGW